MTVVETLHCRQCGHETSQVVQHHDDHMKWTVCSVCGEESSWGLGGQTRVDPSVNRWISYLAHQIGQLKGYDSCQVQEHSIALEIAAREALAGPLPAAVEDQLREALDRVADAWVMQTRKAVIAGE